jgi:hypothetical protein
VSLPKCEHGVAGDDPRYQGMWAAPFSKCLCCGIHFPYIDSASYGDKGLQQSRTWTPKDRCAACGGEYVEYRRDPPAPEER